MCAQLYRLDGEGQSLHEIDRHEMEELGFNEPGDLETWLANCEDDVLGRSILWLARQDRPNHEQRSDLIGVDESGDLLVTELKRGQVGENAVTQALSYAAEYSAKTVEDLVGMYWEHSQKQSATGLLSHAGSDQDARDRLSNHVGESEVNASQILVLVGESFTAGALAVCDYLNSAATEALFSIECWEYSLFKEEDGDLLFGLEQVLPPPSVRQKIEEKREASKSRKYARDPDRMAFMRETYRYLRKQTDLEASRNPGESYSCQVKVDGKDVQVSVHKGCAHPRLILPEDLELSGDASDFGAVEQMTDRGQALEFSDVEIERESFSSDFAGRLTDALEALSAVDVQEGNEEASIATGNASGRPQSPPRKGDED